MKKSFSVIVLLLLSGSVFSQNGELPPVYLPSNTNLCNFPPYKLVLYDEFDGDTLKHPWVTFNSYAGMLGGDHENWREGRWDTLGHNIVKHENVEVSNGSVKLKLIREPSFWQCDTCTITRYENYSSGRIRLPYTGYSFNNGKF